MSHQLVFLATFYAGVKISVKSNLTEKLPPNFILVSNHQSLADIPFLVHAFPNHDLKFIAKKNLKHSVPGVSITLNLGQHAFINRFTQFNQTRKQFKKLAFNISEKNCPVIFPEGTRSKTGKLRKFYTAGIRLLLMYTNLPIISVAVEGGYKITKLKDLFFNVNHLVYRIKIINLYNYQTRSKKKIHGIIQNIYKEISDQLDKWRTNGK